MPRIIQLTPDGKGGRYIRGRSEWGSVAGRDEAPEGRRRGVHPVDAAALAVPEGYLMSVRTLA
jgi:hypothetical protein